jgi:hypothetical protein
MMMVRPPTAWPRLHWALGYLSPLLMLWRLLDPARECHEFGAVRAPVVSQALKRWRKLFVAVHESVCVTLNGHLI